jgi:anti-anti-sigma regulatory factor
MGVLSIKIQHQGSATRVSLEGEITENADFAPVLQEPGELVFDLADVRRINSCGVREWLNLVNGLKQGGKQFALERCSVSVVSQLNMIANFRGGAPVRSIYVPYFCESCSAPHEVLVAVDAALTSRLQDVASCPNCAKPMQFDDLPESYAALTE